MSQSQYEYIDFLVFGHSSVGKTSLLKQLIGEKFQELHYPTTGVEFSGNQIKIGDEIFKIRLWEFAAYENFKQIARQYYKRAKGLILLYDITYHQSFKDLDLHLEEALQHENSILSIFLIGNKVDLDSQRQVSIEQAMNYANEKGIPFLEISVKTKYNMNLALECCLLDVIEKAKVKRIDLKKSINKNQVSESQKLNQVNNQDWFKCY